MIDVLNKMAKDEIKGGTEIVIYYDFEAYVYKYHELYQTFLNDDFKRMEEEFVFGGDFLNYSVKLILPEEKRYLIKLNIKGIVGTYLNCRRKTGILFLGDSSEGQYSQTKFTRQEMQDIQQVREFLEDMKGKYQLIEVK